MSDYMKVLMLSMLVPLVFSFWPPLKFYRSIRNLLYSLATVLVIFGAWDVFATYRGHWYFNPKYVYRFRIINLPLEEVLFFIVIPFCCIFTWEVIKFIKREVR